jgi:co-chaperonin GroES (HSP10)
MPQTKEQIRHAPVAKDSYLSPHHGDGGWHGSSFGSEIFDADWQPLNDRILVKRLPEKTREHSLIVRPEITDEISYRAVVVKMGLGKRSEGEWRKVGVVWTSDENGIQQGTGGEWKWVPVDGRPMSLRVGQEVLIGPHVDWDSFGGEYALCQEADVRVIWPS